jgi:enamine deaminase RidA (YjgF/YER057c/UK114 family)
MSVFLLGFLILAFTAVFSQDLQPLIRSITANEYRITKDFPARATVGTGLVNADGLVEIMFVASK